MCVYTCLLWYMCVYIYRIALEMFFVDIWHYNALNPFFTLLHICFILVSSHVRKTLKRVKHIYTTPPIFYPTYLRYHRLEAVLWRYSGTLLLYATYLCMLYTLTYVIPM